MIPDLAELPPLPGPYEVFELHDGQSAQIVPTSWELGKAVIHPRDGREPREIPILRVHTDPVYKPMLPHYWDITAKHLIAGLLAHMQANPERRYTYTITKHGHPPTARFTLVATPLAG